MKPQKQDSLRESRFVVGSPVSLAGEDISGVIVDVVLNKSRSRVEYAVVAFDTGPGEPILYQPVSWSSLLPVLGGFCLAPSPGDSGDELPEAMDPEPRLYGGNSRLALRWNVPTPQSARVH